jgi:hypothetical protein
VSGPEGDAGLDALRRQEVVAIGVPGHDRLGRPRHELDDARLDGRIGEHALEPGGVEAVLALHLGGEGAHVLPLEVECAGRQRRGGDEQGEARRPQQGCRWHHPHFTSFLLECSAIRIPKPAIRVTNEVPP